jgi:hypothetical protein
MFVDVAGFAAFDNCVRAVVVVLTALTYAVVCHLTVPTFKTLRVLRVGDLRDRAPLTL